MGSESSGLDRVSSFDPDGKAQRYAMSLQRAIPTGDAPEDLVQDSYVVLLERGYALEELSHRERYCCVRRIIKYTWQNRVRVTLTRARIDAARRTDPSTPGDIAFDSDLESRAMARLAERRTAVERLLSLLSRESADDAMIVRMRFLESRPVHEIAVVFDTTERSIRRAIRRAVAKLKAYVRRDPNLWDLCAPE